MEKTHDLEPRWCSVGHYACRVHVNCRMADGVYVFGFDVDEEESCFRLENDQDGAPCWEDSCVEVFLRSGHNASRYFNFECNAGGFMLAECGEGRENRHRFLPAEYSQVDRHAMILSRDGGRVRWKISVIIPSTLIGSPEILFGNLYKCGSKARCVHYLSAFPVMSDKPDFHRPESFRPIFG